jgi:acetyltransferase-like isoleucine patch superfamily enzyme
MTHESRRSFRHSLRVVRAYWYLRRVHEIGHFVRLQGRPIISARGEIRIHERVQLVSTVARLELGTGEHGVLDIGARSLINFGCSIVAFDRVSIGERCLIGPHCMIMDTAFHETDPDRRLEQPTPYPITIGNNVWLGARVIVLPGVTIGDDSVVGIGSIVTANIPPSTLAVGVPARVIQKL